MNSIRVIVPFALFTLASALLPGSRQDLAHREGWIQKTEVPEDREIKLSFWLKLTHTHMLEDIVNKVSDPKSPEYGHYLSKEQVDSLTKPTPEHIATVTEALKGYTVHSQGQGAMLWAVVPIRFAEQLLGGRFVYLCHDMPKSSVATSCLMRNPTARVPEALRDACDIISPIDDPLPPVNPLPGPIISKPRGRRVGSSDTLAQIDQRGCCFSFGYGAMMKPCCLNTLMVEDVSTCSHGQAMSQLVGGASGSSTTCPTSAAEAAKIHASNSQEDTATPMIGTEERKAKAGCCFSVGYGAMMKPCCLQTQMVEDAGTCLVEERDGGASSTSPTCPATAAQAAQWLAAAETAKSRPQAERHVVHSMRGQVAKSQASAHASSEPLQNSQRQGCCYVIGYGAYMAPCCLKSQMVIDEAECNEASRGRMGGAAGFNRTGCPTSAGEAHAWLSARKPAAVALVQKHPGSRFSLLKPIPVLIIIGVAVFGAVAFGGLAAARRRRDSSRIPFLQSDGVE